MIKRSRKTALLLMSAAPLMFTACEKEPELREGLYTSVEACARETGDRVSCDQAFAKAEQQAQEQAPRYASKEECVQQHGEGQCKPASDGRSHSYFMPMMAGFMMSQMMRGNTPASGFNSAPAFKDKQGGFQRPMPGGAGRSALMPVTATPDRAVTSSRSGFGGRSGSGG
jgi:uncharacterized protein YgiB involved in biofilm formation